MTSIITTIGPASLNTATLQHFATHSVRIARLNFSHNTADWHIGAGKTCKEHGLELMLDLAGPKVLLGTLSVDSMILTHEEIAIELQNPSLTYPYEATIDGAKMRVFPCQFPINEYITTSGSPILINDGFIQLSYQHTSGKRVIARVDFGGIMKSNKGINLPSSDLSINFLVERDIHLISQCLPALLPKWIAPSFVKTVDDLDILHDFIEKVKQENNLPADYFPKICTKLEMSEAIEENSLAKIIAKSDMVMVARGDLALETTPAHTMVPFLQDFIVKKAHASNTPVVIATQMLESMITSPVPTRAEVSDIYRAVHINAAEFIMLSGESAVGQFPTKCVECMHTIIHQKAV